MSGEFGKAKSSQPAERTAPPSLCPTCGWEANRWHVTVQDGVSTAYYVCDREHGWLVRWVSA